MKKMPDWQKRLYIQGIVVGVLALTAVAMLGEVARQNWHNKVTAYPTTTETAIETRARQILDSMTLEEKVGQMFIINCPAEERKELIDQFSPGGVMLGPDDFAGRNKSQVAAAISEYQSAAAVPMLIAVEEEGGEMVPISADRGFRCVPFLSPRELFAPGGVSLVQTDTEEKCRLRTELGINTNFAPVADVTTDTGGHMYDRSVGQPASGTVRYVRTVVTVMNEQKVIGALKHFPGYGNLSGDTEAGTVRDDRTAEQLGETDLQPFAEGISVDVPMIMVGHMVCSAIDPSRPASLSEDVYKTLRRELGYDGVIVTDDLTAGAVRQFCGSDEAATAAIRAGNDLLYTSDPSQIDSVLAAVRSGQLSEERINESVLRILKMKIRFNLI